MSIKLSASDWESVVKHLVFIYDGAVEAKYRSCVSTNANYALWLVRRGRVSIKHENRDEIVAETGDWILFPPNDKYYQQFSSDSEIMSVHFVFEWEFGELFFQFDQIMKRSYEKWQRLEPLLVDLLSVYKGRLRKEQHNLLSLDEYSTYNIVYLRFLNSLLLLMENEDVSFNSPAVIDHRMKDALKIMDEFYYTGKIPYDRLSEACSLSRVQIDRLFVEQVKKTPKQYMEMRCLKRATLLLLDPGYSAKEVCYELGFSTLSHFCNWFRRKTAMWPIEYRECNKR